MLNDNIQSLLILQERDTQVVRLNKDIAAIPAAIQKLNDEISAIKADVKATEDALKAKEVKRKELELEVESHEAQILKYKTQQIQIKKTEEFEALNKEIETAQAKISDLEDEELMLMDELDGDQAQLKEVNETAERRIGFVKQQIDEWQAKDERFKAMLQEAEVALEDQKSRMDVEHLRFFERLKTQIKRTPYIVELSGQQCTGCHMRVSNDILKKAKIGSVVACDNCGRMVYVGA